MEKALGLVEVAGLSSAIETADVMAKAANVELVELEAARGSGMMTIKVNGDVGAVRAAVEAGKAAAMSFGALVSVDIIARPNEDTGRVFVRYPGKKERPNFYGSEPEKGTILSEQEVLLSESLQEEDTQHLVNAAEVSEPIPGDTASAQNEAEAEPEVPETPVAEEPVLQQETAAEPETPPAAGAAEPAPIAEKKKPRRRTVRRTGRAKGSPKAKQDVSPITEDTPNP